MTLILEKVSHDRDKDNCRQTPNNLFFSTTTSSSPFPCELHNLHITSVSKADILLIFLLSCSAFSLSVHNTVGFAFVFMFMQSTFWSHPPYIVL